MNLETSFADDRPRALIQMATGSGKTFTAISTIYRLIKYAKVHRVLFLVDRRNLGKQALQEFQQYTTPDDGRKFTELYNVQLLTSNTVDPIAKVMQQFSFWLSVRQTTAVAGHNRSRTPWERGHLGRFRSRRDACAPRKSRPRGAM